MSISLVGFRAADMLTAGTMFRITLSSTGYDVFNEFVSSMLGGDAPSVYGSLYQQTGFLPMTPLAVVTGDESAVIDGMIHDQQRGADFVNKLEMIGSRFCFVSQVQQLTAQQKADSNTDTGAAARDAAAAKVKAAADASSWWNQIKDQVEGLTTFVKWGGAVVGLLAIAYLAHEWHSNRK